ncbi:SPT3 Dosage dependent suppressor of Ty-induced promoter mutations-like protein [Cladophialophora chaetospira]|uniref:SPT3 Dosage dependent suppressor of Ty-induced promoter mutations-like protein n=1 Tax=Cladophialophora chaetospira TaxID=386627 RepID=A0AA38WPB0_9EURO|nr:SPT3 Dosage dependent suppressor of Ty-induced promoter mutations-like protein [Cladophialophora chaetospira]
MATAHDEDMYLFQTGLGQTPSFAGQDFDAFLENPAPDVDQSDFSAGFLNPNDLTIKRESESVSPPSNEGAFHRGSRDSASGSSSTSSESAANQDRNMSATSTASPPEHDTVPGAWGSGINGFSMPANMQLFGDTSMAGMDQDFEVSNQEMDSAFDFETAASTPSGFDVTNKLGHARTPLISQPFNRPANFAGYGKQPPTTQLSGGQPQFFFAGSREASPLNAMVTTGQGQSPWNKHSPSSGLEETFNHITMNGDSPGNATFSPNLQFSTGTFSFDPESSTTPSTFTKDISSPPSTVNSAEGSPTLTVHPTSLKSRVETQIPIKMTLSSLPAGVKKLRLPRYTVSKPKFLAKPEVARSQEILELHTSLVCTSAIQEKVKLQRALARARGEELGPYNRPSPTSSVESGSSKDDEDKPLNGGEVQICPGCIQRERKRASRKKQKKPEEEELFQKDEERRVVVFNTNEIKDWVEIPQDTASNEAQNAPTPAGAVQVELPMRIACYCRHQNEKMGFQVIFTIKDCRDKVIAQALTNPIMITDDHKTHNPPSSVANTSAPLPTPGPQLPGAGVFSTTEQEYQQPQTQASNLKMSRQSYSMTDLHALQHNFNPSFSIPQTNTPFAIPTAMPAQTSNFTPRNLSRPASPSGPSGPTTKRRKQSGSGKVPSGLTMTRLDTSHAPPSSSTMPNTAASSPYAPNMTSYMGPHDRHLPMAHTARPAPYGNNSPPTPSGVESSFAANINRSISQDNIARQVMISAPSSRQPSRPGSPGSARNSFGAADAAFGQAVNNQLMGHHTRRPPPLIHKLVPAEGSVTGGTEVTLLGNGFYQGLEVMFGDTEATTTTFWGEKCLNCIAPPALQPGMVPVMFKHDHPQYSTIPQQSQSRPSLFTYVDDRETEMYRLALRTIGKQLAHPTDDPFTAAQQLLQGQNQSMWHGPGNYGMGGGHQRSAGGVPMDTLELEGMMLQVLEHLDKQRQFKPADLELRRPSGLTLLHLASSLGLTRFVAALLSRGADPNSADNNGHTPMHHAAMNGHTHVIHRLRLAGANHRARSIRHFIPADLATSLLAYQATMTAVGHYRSRSTGGTPMRLHSRSSSSLRSFWENASNHYTDTDDTDSSDDFDDETPTRNPSDEPDLPRAQSSRITTISIPPSRRGSTQPSASQMPAFSKQNAPDQTPTVAPSAFMLAWRDHLVAQLQQFNESAQSVMPSLATLNGPLAALQDYQAYPMVRRVSALFPQRPALRQQQQQIQREGWWEALTGSSSPAPSSPPAYGDLYPDKENETEEDWSTKKISTLRAAADAAADLHFEPRSPEAISSSTKAAVRISPPIERIELSRDRKLFFFWMPLLAIVLALMIRSSGVTTMFVASNNLKQPLSNQEAVGVF